MSKKRDEKIWKQARERALRSIAETSEAEDAALTKAAASDPDNPVIDDAFAKGFRRAVEVAPALVRRMRGPQKTPTKQLISLRLDRDVLAHFRSSGPRWQGRVNAALRKAAGLERK
jgi:uncharacterized protein (DUF4415 family)